MTMASIEEYGNEWSQLTQLSHARREAGVLAAKLRFYSITSSSLTGDEARC